MNNEELYYCENCECHRCSYLKEDDERDIDHIEYTPINNWCVLEFEDFDDTFEQSVIKKPGSVTEMKQYGWVRKIPKYNIDLQKDKVISLFSQLNIGDYVLFNPNVFVTICKDRKLGIIQYKDIIMKIEK